MTRRLGAALVAVLLVTTTVTATATSTSAESVSTGYKTDGIVDLIWAAEHFGYSGPGEMQKAGVSAIRFFLGVAGITENECGLGLADSLDPVGPYVYESEWSAEEAEALEWVADHYCITKAQAQLYGGTLFTFFAGLDAGKNGTTAVRRNPPPSAPTSLLAITGDRSTTLTWTAPASDGGAEITDYVVEYTQGLTSDWWVFEDTTSPETSAIVTGLDNDNHSSGTGSDYRYRVSATNNSGTGEPSAIVNGGPGDVPEAVVSLSVWPGDGYAALSWWSSMPASFAWSAVSDYIIEYAIDPNGSWQTNLASSNPTRTQVGGLTNDTKYLFRVSAINSVGVGPPSPIASTTPEACEAQKDGDWEAPVISNAFASPNPLVSGELVTVSWTVSDESAIYPIIAECSGRGSSFMDVYLNGVSYFMTKEFPHACVKRTAGDRFQGTYSCTRRVPEGLPEGTTISFNIRALDPRGLVTYESLVVPVLTSSAG